MMSDYSEDAAMVSLAHYLKGLTYEKENKWNMALAEYTLLKEKYPDTRLGLEMPIYIAKYYATKGRRAESEKAYSEAIIYYEKIERDNRGKLLGYASSALLIQVYLNTQNYEQAGAALKKTLDNYPSRMTLAQLLPFIEPVYVEKLNNASAAIEIYKTIMEKTRDDKLKNFLSKRIEFLGKRK